MKVIVEVSEKAIKKAKAIILFQTDLDEKRVDWAIEECKQEDVTEILDASIGFTTLENSMKLQIGFAVLAIVQKLKILDDE
ncbi:MAG: hypothetical protein IJK08_02015 [Prevotella sp.]|nr:hypothetical protein [Prevotella sp.]